MHTNTEFYDAITAAVIGWTAAVIEWTAAVKRACDIQPTSHPENLTAETICRLTGLLPLYPFNVPEGYVATGAMSIVSGVSTPVESDDPRHKIECVRCDGKGKLYGSEIGEVEGADPFATYTCPACNGTGCTLDPLAAYKRYDVITIEQHEAARAAWEAAQEAEAAQARHTRLLGLVDAYGADIAIMGRLLAMFPDPVTGEPITFPCEASDVMIYIKGGLATGQISLDMAPYAQTLETRYDKVKTAMSNAEIAAVAEILKGMQQ
jgi:hypothetical protein